MTGYQLTEKADLRTCFEISRMQYSDEEWQKLTQGLATPERFIHYCTEQGFDTLGFSYNGKPIGGLIFDGQAVHISVLPEHHGRWGSLLRKAWLWTFSHKDPIDVKIYANNEKALLFMDRHNWPRIHEDENFVTYRMSSQAVSRYFRHGSGDQSNTGSSGPRHEAVSA